MLGTGNKTEAAVENSENLMNFHVSWCLSSFSNTHTNTHTSINSNQQIKKTAQRNRYYYIVVVNIQLGMQKKNPTKKHFMPFRFKTYVKEQKGFKFFLPYIELKVRSLFASRLRLTLIKHFYTNHQLLGNVSLKNGKD